MISYPMNLVGSLSIIGKLKNMHLLKYIQIETTTTCNQRCYFCPVSTGKRPKKTMSLEMLQKILENLQPYSHQIEKIYTNGFNEPTFDKTLVEKMQILHRYHYKVQLNTNGSGLTPNLLHKLLDTGLKDFCINLSSTNQDYYQLTRKSQDLENILTHLHYLLKIKEQPLVVQILILGNLDKQHAENIQNIMQAFSYSNAQLIVCPAVDFAGLPNYTKLQIKPYELLEGCFAKRDLEWLHFTPSGQAILCCQDYQENYIVGNILQESAQQLYSNKQFAQFRRWISGEEIAPKNFICRTCVFAISPSQIYQEKIYQTFCEHCSLPTFLDNICDRCVVSTHSNH